MCHSTGVSFPPKQILNNIKINVFSVQRKNERNVTKLLIHIWYWIVVFFCNHFLQRGCIIFILMPSKSRVYSDKRDTIRLKCADNNISMHGHCIFKLYSEQVIWFSCRDGQMEVFRNSHPDNCSKILAEFSCAIYMK